MLRPSTFQRLHGTHGSVASRHSSPANSGTCVEASLRPVQTSDQPVWVGLDVALKNDGTGCVGCAVGGRRPTAPRLPPDLACTRGSRSGRAVPPVGTRAVPDPCGRSIRFKPLRTVAILRDAGLQVEEMPQTVSATTAMGEVLYELLTHRQLRLYPASDLRTQALATTAIEHARGMRIAKVVGSKKIDAISALAMAVCELP